MPWRIWPLALVALFAISADVRGAAPTAISGDVAGLIDIGGGRKLYFECKGAGSPVVILEAGLRNRADIWSVKPDAGAAVVVASCNARTSLGRRPSELAQLLPNTPHRTATKSSHYVQIEEPQLVIDAVRQVVEAARAERPPR